MIGDRREEIEALKAEINLAVYAAAEGYLLDRNESSRNSLTMRHPDGDKIIIGREARSGHWIYFSVHDSANHGTIIDFIQNRFSVGLGEARKRLRPWLGKNPPTLPSQALQGAGMATVEPISRDLARIKAQVSAMTPLQVPHPYLEHERHIPADIQTSPRFAKRIYTDPHGNAVFPHSDQDGLCGFEIRNTRFKGFAKGGCKGLWYSNHRPNDHALVITESAIEALSYHALHLPEGTRYFSIAGEMSPAQHTLLQSAFRKLPPAPPSLIIATNNDTAGWNLAQTIKAIASQTGRDDLAVIEHTPDQDGADWNDMLKEGHAPPRLP